MLIKTAGADNKTDATHAFNMKGDLAVKKDKIGARYETPTLDVVFIDCADVITTSPVCEGDYDENGWT